MKSAVLLLAFCGALAAAAGSCPLLQPGVYEHCYVCDKQTPASGGCCVSPSAQHAQKHGVRLEHTTLAGAIAGRDGELFLAGTIRASLNVGGRCGPLPLPSGRSAAALVAMAAVDNAPWECRWTVTVSTANEDGAVTAVAAVGDDNSGVTVALQAAEAGEPLTLSGRCGHVTPEGDSLLAHFDSSGECLWHSGAAVNASGLLAVSHQQQSNAVILAASAAVGISGGGCAGSQQASPGDALSVALLSSVGNCEWLSTATVSAGGSAEVTSVAFPSSSTLQAATAIVALSGSGYMHWGGSCSDSELAASGSSFLVHWNETSGDCLFAHSFDDFTGRIHSLALSDDGTRLFAVGEVEGTAQLSLAGCTSLPPLSADSGSRAVMMSLSTADGSCQWLLRDDSHGAGSIALSAHLPPSASAASSPPPSPFSSSAAQQLMVTGNAPSGLSLGDCKLPAQTDLVVLSLVASSGECSYADIREHDVGLLAAQLSAADMDDSAWLAYTTPGSSLEEASTAAVLIATATAGDVYFNCSCAAGQWGPACTPCGCVHGSCADGLDGNGTCSCPDDYAGPTCSAHCPGKPPCGGHGRCDSDIGCACDKGWDGDSCSERQEYHDDSFAPEVVVAIIAITASSLCILVAYTGYSMVNTRKRHASRLYEEVVVDSVEGEDELGFHPMVGEGEPGSPRMVPL